jgi:hypothetical protein
MKRFLKIPGLTVFVAAAFILVSCFGAASWASSKKGAEAQPPTTPLKWQSDADGKIEGDTFVRTSTPPLTLDLLPGFATQPFQSSEILRGAPPAGLPSLQIYVFKINKGADVKAILKGYANFYKAGLGLAAKKGSEVKILKNEPTDAYDEFPAYESEYEWQHPSVLLVTLVHIIAKDGYGVVLAGHTTGNTDPLLGIFETLDLEP